MGYAIAIMITKGGVGKSTLVMALAETFSVFHNKRVLVIDSDSQSSLSSMMMPMGELRRAQDEGRTIVEVFNAAALQSGRPDWRRSVVDNVSDVDDADTISLLPCKVQLTLLEREIAISMRLRMLQDAVQALLADARGHFDLVLIDCPPGLSFLTEAWMRKSDYYVSPTKPDYLGLYGLQALKQFKELNPEGEFAENLGVLVNMRDMRSVVDEKFHQVLMDDPSHRCISQAIPSNPYLQHAALYDPDERSFPAKYPGDVGSALRIVSQELLDRIGRAATRQDGPVANAAADVMPPDRMTRKV